MSAITDTERNLVGPLGILSIEIDERVVSMAKGLRGPYGIIVAARAAGATTEVPLMVGDVIRDLNGKPMTTLRYTALRTAQPASRRPRDASTPTRGQVDLSGVYPRLNPPITQTKSPLRKSRAGFLIFCEC